MNFTTLLHYANELAKNFPWDVLIASGVLSPLLAGFKKVFSVKSERVMISLVVLLSAITVGGNYLLHVPTTDPRIIAIQTAVLAFATQPVYFFIVKPAIAAFRSYIERAAKFNLEIKSAEVPAGGLPNIPEGQSVSVNFSQQPPVPPKSTDVVDFKS